MHQNRCIARDCTASGRSERYLYLHRIPRAFSSIRRANHGCPASSRSILVAKSVAREGGLGILDGDPTEHGQRRLAMSLRPQHPEPVPDETARVARAAFPAGNLYLQMRDTLETIYADTDFLHLFPAHGKPGYAPWRL